MPFAKPPKLDEIEQAPGIDEAVADVGASASSLVAKSKAKAKPKRTRTTRAKSRAKSAEQTPSSAPPSSEAEGERGVYSRPRKRAMPFNVRIPAADLEEAKAIAAAFEDVTVTDLLVWGLREQNSRMRRLYEEKTGRELPPLQQIAFRP